MVVAVSCFANTSVRKLHFGCPRARITTKAVMSGHSKWSTIKRKKAAIDSKRGKVFTRLLKEIQVAAKMGGGSPDGNPRLKTAVLSAKAQSVPQDNIERAIKRGTGDMEGVDYEEVVYEGYGPAGVAILIKTLTDNRNRTVAEVRHALTRCGGSLGSTNSVAYQFTDKGMISIPRQNAPEEEVFESALEAGAEDIVDTGDSWEVSTPVEAFHRVIETLSSRWPESEGEIRPIPNVTVPIAGKHAEALIKLLDMLDDLDDVQDVIANFEMDDEELERAAGD